ncbi:MAG: cytochrome c-type biogenesis protein CcmH [Actinomycetota bacterium]|nr:cytochrome c-type biogenesis protein CcmH [Actinomycetota bacterium]
MSKALWVALFAGVLGVSLWQGAQRPAPSTPTARMEQIASELRCPVCIDESAAQANTAAARAIRADIATRLRSGQSERQIIDYMVSRYGRWILLSPPSSGLGLTVWLAPIAVTLGALAVVVVAWARAVRRFRAPAPAVTDAEAELRGERDLPLADRTQRVGEERAST